MNYNELMAERKANHEALLASIDIQIKELMNKRTLAKETYRAENRGITEAYHQAVVNTAEGRRKRILSQSHDLHRVFTRVLNDPTHLGGVYSARGVLRTI